MIQTRIAFTGAGGTGKGTILSLVRKQMPHIIPISSPMESLTKRYLGERKNYLDGNEAELRTKQWMGLSAQYWTERTLDNAEKSFISERSCMDYLSYWNQQLPFDEAYRSLAIEGCYNYDIVFYFPCDFKNTQEEIAAHTWKERDFEKRKKTDETISSLWKEFQEKENRSGFIQFIKLFGSEHNKANIVIREIKRMEARIRV